MELALGTVQFGVVYGLSGATTILSDEGVREILELAYERGIRSLDTAPGYGDIEARLGQLCQGLEFEFVSKIPPFPKIFDEATADRWAVKCGQASHERLGRKLKALIFHRAEDLFGDFGPTVWNALQDWTSSHGILLGASGYEVDVIRKASEAYEIAVAQLPGNALDQRFKGGLSNLRAPPKLQLRSPFLQGVLLMPVDDVAGHVASSIEPVRRWHDWLKRRALSPMQGALSLVKGFEDAKTCVLGVDSIAHLREIVDTWDKVSPIGATELASDDLGLIDPRTWSKRKT